MCFQKDKKLKCFVRVSKYGTIEWTRGPNRVRHRYGGPAVITLNETKWWWYLNGRCHRVNGPAILSGGFSMFYLHGWNITEELFLSMSTEERTLYSGPGRSLSGALL